MKVRRKKIKTFHFISERVALKMEEGRIESVKDINQKLILMVF